MGQLHAAPTFPFLGYKQMSGGIGCMPDTDELTEPVTLTLAARNLYGWIILAQLFLLWNGEYLYGISSWMVIGYLVGPTLLTVGMLTMTRTNKGTPLTWESIEKSMMPKKDLLSKYISSSIKTTTYFSAGIQIIYFSLATGLSAIVFMGLIMAGYLVPQATPAGMALPLIISNLILVIPAETYMFHGIVPMFTEMTVKKSQYSQWIMYGVSQGIFALFHYAATGGSAGSMAFIFGMGVILLYIARNYGLPAAAGVHFAWNMAVLGILLFGV